MRKLRVLMFAAAAMFAITAVVAPSAFAFKELLSNGVVAPHLEILIQGEIVLHDLNNGAEVLCSGDFDGLVEAGGKTGAINEVLTLGGLLVAATAPNLVLALVSGDAIECTAVKLCEKVVPEDVLVVALKLPWALKVEEPESLDLEGVEYNLDCLFLGVLFENTCSGLAIALILNDPVTGDAAAKFEEDLPHLTCDNGDEANAFSEGEEDPLLVDLGGSLLTWS